jgi:hypothetical protein
MIARRRRNGNRVRRNGVSAIGEGIVVADDPSERAGAGQMDGSRMPIPIYSRVLLRLSNARRSLLMLL